MQENNKLTKLFSQRNKKIALVKSTIKKCKSQFKLLDANRLRPKCKVDLKPNEGDHEDDMFKLSSQDSLYSTKHSFDDMKEMRSIESKESINSKKQDEDMLYDCTEDFRKSVDVDLEMEAHELRSMQDEMKKLLSSKDKHIVDADEKDGNEDIVFEFKRTNLDNLYHVTKKQVTHSEPKTNKNQTDNSEKMNSDKVTEINNEEDFSEESETFYDDDEVVKGSSIKYGTGNGKKAEKKRCYFSIKSLMLWLIIVIIGYLFLKEK